MNRSSDGRRARLAPLAASFAMNPTDAAVARSFSRALRIATTEQEDSARALELATRTYAVAQVHPCDTDVAHDAATAMLRVLRLQDAFDPGRIYLGRIESLHGECPDLHVAICFAQGVASLLEHPCGESSRAELLGRLEELGARHGYSVDFAEAAAEAFRIAADEASSDDDLRAIRDALQRLASRHPRSLRIDTALGGTVILERVRRAARSASHEDSRAS